MIVCIKSIRISVLFSVIFSQQVLYNLYNNCIKTYLSVCSKTLQNSGNTCRLFSCLFSHTPLRRSSQFNELRFRKAVSSYTSPEYNDKRYFTDFYLQSSCCKVPLIHFTIWTQLNCTKVHLAASAVLWSVFEEGNLTSANAEGKPRSCPSAADLL